MKSEKDLGLSLYYDFYGSFLTDKQAKVFELYYNDDYSLAEIAQECGVTRQGVPVSYTHLDVYKRQILSSMETRSAAAASGYIARNCRKRCSKHSVSRGKKRGTVLDSCWKLSNTERRRMAGSRMGLTVWQC